MVAAVLLSSWQGCVNGAKDLFALIKTEDQPKYVVRRLRRQRPHTRRCDVWHEGFSFLGSMPTGQQAQAGHKQQGSCSLAFTTGAQDGSASLRG